jgi:hypothetical protein
MKNPETTPFVVGRIAKDGRRLMVLNPTPASPAPIPGPWDLRAVFAA